MRILLPTTAALLSLCSSSAFAQQHQQHPHNNLLQQQQSSSSHLEAVDLAETSLETRKNPEAQHAKWRFKFGGPGLKGDTLYGVGLGGWLVLEPFLNPSIFAASQRNATLVHDEWTLAQSLPRQQLEPILRKHYAEWIIEDDFAKMRDYGINAVRIPIPHWTFGTEGDEPYLQLNQWETLLQGLKWAQKYGIKAIVDLHTVPGSQNGYDHSGRRGPRTWDKDPKNVARTLLIIEALATEFSQDKWADTVIAIELVNEPKSSVDMAVLKNYYDKAYHIIRSKGNLAMMISDSFIGIEKWNTFMPPPAYEGLIIDAHYYYVFNHDDLAATDANRTAKICRHQKPLFNINKNFHFTVVGEWSPSFTDCAVDLNGRGSGSRYDGTYGGGGNNNGMPPGPPIGTCDFQRGPSNRWTPEAKRRLAKWWETSMDGFYTGSGGFMWTWKTEPGMAEDFSYSAGVANGWIPKDPRQRPNGNYCPDSILGPKGTINLSMDNTTDSAVGNGTASSSSSSDTSTSASGSWLRTLPSSSTAQVATGIMAGAAVTLLLVA